MHYLEIGGFGFHYLHSYATQWAYGENLEEPEATDKDDE